MIFRIAARNSALRLILNPNGKDTEVTKNIRTFALPFEERPYTFTMEFDYDSWNRIQKMTYPDKEEVSYGYDSGGMLRSMTGCKDSTTYKYIDSIHYNKFGLKKAVCYGNRATTFYKYDVLQRLSHLHSTNGTGNTMQDIDYKYDAVSNIVGIANGAGITANGPGGKYENTYEYDNLYRLVYSNGRWDGAHPVRYELKMNYTPNGRIVRKHLDARTCMQMPHATEIDSVIYCNEYHYTTSSQPNTLTSIDNGLHQDFKWDAKGNLLFHHTEASAMDRSLCWDERNRLAGVKDHEFLSYYQYDANGDRVFKISGGYTVYNRNGHWYRYYGVNCPTLYASPYMVATLKGYTKHYYAESERVASRIGGGGLHGIDGNDNPDRFAVHAEHSTGLFNQVTDCLEAQAEVPASPLKSLYEWKDKKEAEKDCYWYHSDHLGSSSWITYSDGKAVEHLHYMPWGEDFVRQRSTDWHARYTFSAKEKDAETGYSYFGARYYSSDLSIWLSVDPMSDKYASMSPYAYCADNPVKLVDPNGEEINPIFSTSGELLGVDSKGWRGTAIVMDKKDFKNGMKHEDALKKGTELDKYGKGIDISDSDWKKIKANGGERMMPTVENHSDEDIYFKPETDIGDYKNDGAYPLEKGKDLYLPVDGIKTSKVGNGKVFKIPDGFRGEVWKNGEPNVKNLPFEHMFSIINSAGKIKTPDNTWNKLENSIKL